MMIGETKTCERCGVEFVKKTHNQLYHNNECTRLATNTKIKVKYHQRRAQRLGLKRPCASCGNPLSRYNPDSICNSCSVKGVTERKESVMTMIANVAWQV